MRTMKKIAASVAVVSAIAMTAACGSDDTADTAAAESTTASTPMEEDTPMEEESPADEGMDPAANLVGPGCEGYAEQVPDGAGSVEGMSKDPVATAASNNPLLKTLVSAVSGQLNPDVNLVDTLNGGEFTVFAPVDDAFAKIDPATIESLKTDSATLTSILTYHVVPGQIAPSDIDGTHATVQGADLTVSGSGDDITVNDSAKVICGHTATA